MSSPPPCAGCRIVQHVARCDGPGAVQGLLLDEGGAWVALLRPRAARAHLPRAGRSRRAPPRREITRGRVNERAGSRPVGAERGLQSPRERPLRLTVARGARPGTARRRRHRPRSRPAGEPAGPRARRRARRGRAPGGRGAAETGRSPSGYLCSSETYPRRIRTAPPTARGPVIASTRAMRSRRENGLARTAASRAHAVASTSGPPNPVMNRKGT